MKKIILKPLAVMTLASFSMFGCASSNENSGSTAYNDGVSMNQTQKMGGDAGVETLVVEEQVVVPVATLSVTSLVMENPVKVADMFEEIEDTEQYDVLDLARSTPNLSTFVKLIEQAGLVDDLKRIEKFTLFAPTNEAFSKIPEEKLQSLLTSDNKALLYRMLQAHIVPSEVSSAQLDDNTRIRMSEDSYVAIDSGIGGTVTTVGGAQIVKSDIEASNGTIHVVDAIVTPTEDFGIGTLR